MTKEEARIIILENALVQAQHTITFLHGCLTNPTQGKMGQPGFIGGHSYEYPEHTLTHLTEFAQLVPLPLSCHHSYHAPDRGQPCPACEQSRTRRILTAQAEKILAE